MGNSNISHSSKISLPVERPKNNVHSCLAYPCISVENLMNKEKLVNGKFSVQLSKDHFYEGNFVDSQRCGLGHDTQKIGEEIWSYTGTFREDKKHDKKGTMFNYTKNIKFQGKFCNDNLVSGTAIYDSGDIYNGEFRHYKRHGNGIMRRVEEEKELAGEWYFDEIRRGRIYFGKTRKYYDGQIRYEIPWGSGKLEEEMKNGEVVKYIGEFHGGKKIGLAVEYSIAAPFTPVEITSSYKFEGMFENNVKHGPGILRKNRIRYEGQWDKGLMKGIFRVKLEGTGGEYFEHYVRGKLFEKNAMKKY